MSDQCIKGFDKQKSIGSQRLRVLKKEVWVIKYFRTYCLLHFEHKAVKYDVVFIISRNWWQVRRRLLKMFQKSFLRFFENLSFCKKY